MKPIKVTYYPFRRLNIAFSANGSIPDDWDEFTPAQIIALGRTYSAEASDIDFLAALSSLPRRVVKKLDDFQRFKIGEAIDFFDRQTMSSRFIISSVEIDGQTWFTPKPKLKGMSFGQFIFTDTWFGIYQQTRKPDDLHRFLASLCLRNPKAFDEEEAENNPSLFARLKPEVKEALVLNYQLVKSWLMKSYPLVFPEPEPAVAIEGKQKETETVFDPNSWIRIFDSLVGDDIPNRDSYAAWPVNEALRYLSRKIKENLKRKK